MTRIGLISDTHGFLDEAVFQHFALCDEIWHAGDFGDIELARRLADFKPLRRVYGNIDGQELRHEFPEELCFMCEDVKIFMTHIGGYPGRYAKGVKEKIICCQPQLFISGHSHILKVMFDKTLDCLHINPGAAGKQGWHKARTLVRFQIAGQKVEKCEVIELGGK